MCCQFTLTCSLNKQFVAKKLNLFSYYMSSLSALLINDDSLSVPFSLDDKTGGFKLGRFQVP